MRRNEKGLTVVELLLIVVLLIVAYIVGNMAYQAFNNFKIAINEKKTEQSDCIKQMNEGNK